MFSEYFLAYLNGNKVIGQKNSLILTQWMSIQSNECQFIDLWECTKERV